MDKQSLLEILRGFLGHRVIEDGITFGIDLNKVSILDGAHISGRTLTLILRDSKYYNNRGKEVDPKFRRGGSIVCDINGVSFDDEDNLIVPNLEVKIEKNNAT